MSKSDKHKENKDLQQTQISAYKPAYKQNPKIAPKQAEIDTSKLPSDLAEIVAVWPELPEHIKRTIQVLVRSV